MLGLLLRWYDLAYRGFHGLTAPDAEVGQALRVQVARHKGRAVRLADGSEIRRRDPIGIIHLHNEHVAKLHDEGGGQHAGALRLRRAFVASLGRLARQVEKTDRYSRVKAFTATTILHAATQRVGFESRPLPSRTWSRLVAAYQRALVAHLSPLGPLRVTPRRFRDARAIWISRETLLRRYGVKPPSGEPGVASPVPGALTRPAQPVQPRRQEGTRPPLGQRWGA
ncbi:MAG: hypothetical protein ACE5FK_04880 [Candidatus Methylomirabilia bacterium]